MEYNNAELLALNLMERTDFKNIKRNEMASFASMLAVLRPDVAKEIIAKFPELADFMKTTLVEYRTILENIIKADDGSLNNYYKINHEGLDDIKDARIYYKDICEKVLTNLDKLLDDDDLSVEESLKIINQQKEILELVNKHDEMAFEQEKYYEEKANIKDSEKRQFSWKTIGTISGAIVGVAVITVAALSGGNINLKLPDKKI